MKEKILKYLSSQGFKKSLRKKELIFGTINEYLGSLLMTRKGASIKDTIGIYVLFNEDNVYYIGISFNEPFRKRVVKHFKRSLGTFKDKPVKAFDDFCKLLKENNQCSENGKFYANCKVLWLPILNDDLTKGELEFLESKCVHELEPILNNEIYNVFGFDYIKL